MPDGKHKAVTIHTIQTVSSRSSLTIRFHSEMTTAMLVDASGVVTDLLVPIISIGGLVEYGL